MPKILNVEKSNCTKIFSHYGWKTAIEKELLKALVLPNLDIKQFENL